MASSRLNRQEHDRVVHEFVDLSWSTCRNRDTGRRSGRPRSAPFSDYYATGKGGYEREQLDRHRVRV